MTIEFLHPCAGSATHVEHTCGRRRQHLFNQFEGPHQLELVTPARQSIMLDAA